MTPIQREYQEKLVRRMEEKRAAAAAANFKAEAALRDAVELFNLGRYKDAVASLEAGRRTVSDGSLLGGKIALWLGQALDAAGRTADAVALYAELETTHPSANVRKQAVDLRFITEAPRLELGPDERVTVPLLGGGDGGGVGAYKDTRAGAVAPGGRAARKREPTLEEQFLDSYTPPSLLPNRYAAVAAAVIAAGLALYSAGL